ncbi:MAG: hypothetical protein ACE5J3_11850 [Methanosarcinales archaeon]
MPNSIIKKYHIIVLGLVLVSIFSVSAYSAIAQPVPLPPPPVPIEVTPLPLEKPDFTKLQITPRYGNLQIKPGESKEIKVKVKNLENKTVKTQVIVEIPPYGEYLLEKEWIKVTPSSAEIPADGKQEYTIKVSIPKDAEIGYYSGVIAFTNDTFPTPYPTPFPEYVNSFRLSVNVWKPPVIQFYPRYISDRVEPGQTYTYDIQLENTGNKAIAINPEIGGEVFYGPYMEGAIPEEWITIDSPDKVNANSKATVKITIKVPSDAKGRYSGAIKLNIDDPSLKEWDQQVQINLEVWNPPSEPFTKTFEVQSEGKNIKITISASQYSYDRYSANIKKPSFKVTLKDPEGKEINAIVTNRTEQGSVNLGIGYKPRPPWEMESESGYTEERTQYSETYSINKAISGTWKLEILPKDTDRFDYIIEIGG